MFNKIRIENNIIYLIKCTVVWFDNINKKSFDAISLDEANAIRELLLGQGIKPDLILNEIPPDILKYEGVIFDGDMTDAVEYINGIGKYNQIAIEIAKLKECLKNPDSEFGDSKAIKYAEGWLSEEEYAPIKKERQRIRDQINELQKLLQSD